MDDLKEKYRDLYIANKSGSAKYIWQYHLLYPRWKHFLHRFNSGKKIRILDFGCGPGFALKAGKEYNLDITGLDIDIDPVYRDIHAKLNVSRVVYDGVHIPEFEHKFDVLLFHWSFVFDFSHYDFTGIPPIGGTSLEQRIQQLKDITNENGYWYISPFTHYEMAKEYVKGIKLRYFKLK